MEANQEPTMWSKLKLQVVILVSHCDIGGATTEYAELTGVGRLQQLGGGSVTQLDWQPLVTAADISVTTTDLRLSAPTDVRCTKHIVNNSRRILQPLSLIQTAFFGPMLAAVASKFSPWTHTCPMWLWTRIHPVSQDTLRLDSCLVHTSYYTHSFFCNWPTFHHRHQLGCIHMIKPLVQVLNSSSLQK